MKTYTVLVEALGYAGGCARKGDSVTEDQLGAENVDRLAREGFILADFVPEAKPKAEAKAEPRPKVNANSKVKPRPKVEVEAKVEAKGSEFASNLSVGIPPNADYEPTEEEAAWLLDVQAGVVPVPFDEEKVSKLTVAEINVRIVGMGVDALKDPKKSEAVASLKLAVADFIGSMVIGEDGTLSPDA